MRSSHKDVRYIVKSFQLILERANPQDGPTSSTTKHAIFITQHLPDTDVKGEMSEFTKPLVLLVQTLLN